MLFELPAVGQSSDTGSIVVQNLPSHHNDDEADAGNDESRAVCLLNVVDHEYDFIHAASVTDALRVCQVRQSQFRNELIYGNDEPNGTDETAQERAAQDAVQEAQSDQTSDQDHAARHACYHAAYPSMKEVVILLAVPRVDASPNSCPHKE